MPDIANVAEELNVLGTVAVAVSHPPSYNRGEYDSVEYLKMKDDANKPDEIEVTPEMIKAGASVLCSFETLTASEEYWAEKVYKAMSKASRSKMVQELSGRS